MKKGIYKNTKRNPKMVRTNKQTSKHLVDGLYNTTRQKGIDPRFGTVRVYRYSSLKNCNNRGVRSMVLFCSHAEIVLLTLTEACVKQVHSTTTTKEKSLRTILRYNNTYAKERRVGGRTDGRCSQQYY